MIRIHRLLGRLSLLLVLLALPGAAGAQELYTFTASVLGGIGGSPDVDRGDDLGNTGYQVNLGLVTDPRSHVALRLGRLTLDQDDVFGSLTDAELTYATLAGEYRFRQTFYESGVYIGLGAYRLEGTRERGGDESDTAPGLSVGVTGEFKVNRSLGVLVELSGHYADLDQAQVFAMGHVGIAVHF